MPAASLSGLKERRKPDEPVFHQKPVRPAALYPRRAAPGYAVHQAEHQRESLPAQPTGAGGHRPGGGLPAVPVFRPGLPGADRCHRKALRPGAGPGHRGQRQRRGAVVRPEGLLRRKHPAGLQRHHLRLLQHLVRTAERAFRAAASEGGLLRGPEPVSEAGRHGDGHQPQRPHRHLPFPGADRGHPQGQPGPRGHRGRGLCGLRRRKLRAPHSPV